MLLHEQQQQQQSKNQIDCRRKIKTKMKPMQRQRLHVEAHNCTYGRSFVNDVTDQSYIRILVAVGQKTKYPRSVATSFRVVTLSRP